MKASASFYGSVKRGSEEAVDSYSKSMKESVLVALTGFGWPRKY